MTVPTMPNLLQELHAVWRADQAILAVQRAQQQLGRLERVVAMLESQQKAKENGNAS